MAGISHATLLIEAAEQSGTLITARLATDYNRDVLVVPGDIFSPNSRGVHQFLKLGATPVTSGSDILFALGIDPHDVSTPDSTASKLHTALTPAEQQILHLLNEPTDRDTLIRASKLPTATANTLLMEMEMKGFITSAQNVYRAII